MDRLESPLPFFEAIEGLKLLKRSGWCNRNVPSPESVSDHMYQMAIWCMSYPNVTEDERTKAIWMCLIHDIGETTAGDITPADGISHERKHLLERLGLKYLSCLLNKSNPKLSDKITQLWDEYEKGETTVAKLVRQVDKLECFHQALIYQKRYQNKYDLSDFKTMRNMISDEWLAVQADRIMAEWAALTREEKPLAKIIFVIGGPGSGKGTQCARITKAFNYEHISVGDLLREEQSTPGSLFGEFLQESFENSVIVPASLTMLLLKNRVQIIQARGNGVLIDGFPRSIDQAVAFEQEVSAKYHTLFLECSRETMVDRLLQRSRSSQRDDDSKSVIKKRLETFYETNEVVLDHLSKNPLKKIDCSGTVDEVYSLMQEAVRTFEDGNALDL